MATKPTASADPREIEIKFDLTPEALPALEKVLSRLDGEVELKTLRATYFDTPAGDLAKAGFSLRLRDDGRRRVQTLKRADGGAFDRSEWEAPANGPVPNLDAPGHEAVRDLVEEAGPLAPRFANRVERRQWTVDHGGARIEIALDQGETEADGRRTAFTELELELKAGEPAALFSLARNLAVAAPLRLSFLTKAGRGAQLFADDAPGAVKSAPARLRAGLTTGQAFTVLAGGCLRQIVANERVLRLHRRPEALHQMRVGLRRLRSALSMFKDVVGDDRLAAIKAEARWLTKQLDVARDLDVFIAETFQPAAHRLGEGEGGGAFGRRLLRAQTEAYDKTLKALETPRAVGFPLKLAEWLQGGAWTQDPALASWRDQPLGDFAQATLEHQRRRIKRKGRRLSKLDPEARHRVRIAVKKLRYGVEFFAPLYPRSRVRRFSSALKGLQDDLGVLNDIAVARRTASGLTRGGGAASGQLGFVAGLLVGLRAENERDRLADAADGRRALLKARRPWKT